MRNFLICLLIPAAVAVAQENPLTAFSQRVYGHLKVIVMRSAEKMPEESYSFRPTDTVRTYGKVLGHVADTQYFFCSAVLGEKAPTPNIEKTKTTKAEVISALKEAFAYCDRAYATMTDANGIQPVKLMTSNAPKLGVLNTNITHTGEHYGNLVTYMRIKNIVPPSSETPYPPPAKQ